MKELLNVMLGFLPWIAFGAISGDSFFRLDIAVIAAQVLTVVMGFKQLARGFVLTWGSFVFFSANLVMVVLLRNMWVINNLDILSHLTLAVIAWFSIIIGKPFILQYARQTTPPERQNSPLFYPISRNLSALWGMIFLITTFLSVAKTNGWLVNGIGFQAASLGLMILGLCLNHWYPRYVRSRVKKEQA